MAQAGAVFSVRVKPRAAATDLLGVDVGARRIVVAVRAPPAEGRANAELERFLSRLLGARVRVKAGGASKEKLVEVLHVRS